MSRLVISLILPTIMYALISCNSGKEKPAETESTEFTVAVTNYPLYFFAITIGGDKLKIQYPETDGDPSYWKPTPEQIGKFQHADLILINGAGFEKWMDKVSLPAAKIVNTSASFKDRYLDSEEEIIHSHGDEGEHVHKGTASAFWVNFALADKQAEAVFEALSSLDPEQSSYFRENYLKLKAQLIELDGRMKKLSGSINGRNIIASHPVYQYLHSAYDLNLTNLHWEPDEMPSEAQWEDLNQIVSENNLLLMIWEAEPIEEIKHKLDSLEIKYTVFDLCPGTPESGNFLQSMAQNVSGIENIALSE